MKPLGIVVCGGKSSRMGRDKSQLVYHGAPQHIFLADLLAQFCEEVVISCNETQFLSLKTNYKKVCDSPEFGDHGPIAAILTAFQIFPDKDVLAIGCDYPFLDEKELALFLSSIQRDSLAAAFYNNEGKYEPMLAWYSKKSASLLDVFYQNGEQSLQHFLLGINAEKYLPESENSMISVDMPEDFVRISDGISKTK